MENKPDKGKKKKSPFAEKFTKCLSGPKQILRTTVLFTCTVVIVYQIAECLRKIQNPPITTYTHFDYNDTLSYPAVTFCRDPSYKNDVLKQYGLFAHPRFTSEWRKFNFDETNLDDFWKIATYSDFDNVLGAGLNSSVDEIDIVNSIHFNLGQCQTIYPKTYMTTSNKEKGYSILLNHSFAETDTSITVPPGYHIFIHDVNEPFTEFLLHSFMSNLYVYVGEYLEVKLELFEAKLIPSGPRKCRPEDDYSSSMCAKECIWKKIIETANCSGPWLDVTVPYCNNYTMMKKLIFNYVSNLDDVECVCPRRCRSLIYNTYVIDRNSATMWDSQNHWIERTGLHKIQSQIYIYFNSRLISVYEESYSYDWSSFLADFGGSMGFLLGLSVLGVMLLLEDIFDNCVKPLISSDEKPPLEEIKRDKKTSVTSNGSSSTNYSNKSDVFKDYDKYNIKYDGKYGYM